MRSGHRGETANPAVQQPETAEAAAARRRRDMRSIGVMLVAGIMYIGLGVAIPELLFSWFEGAAFLALFAAALHRWERGRA
ncbi:MAG TPA: hypothetical protein VMM78_03135 [Thermomicrobiales bacterium]|nr:hypothetical protein [Thermomicrobiales bacterium]